MNYLVNLVNLLNSPHLVAKTQEFFGIELIGVVKSTESNGNVKDSNQNRSLTNGKVHSNGTADDEESDKQNKKYNKPKEVNLLDNRKCLYQINYKFFYYFFLFITHMGNEIFYIVFLPILMWCYSDKTMYLTCISWSILMYIGQATKDIIKLPRPMTPPVVKIEEKYLLEYGFPSTHAMAAFGISFTLLTFVFQEFNSAQDADFRFYTGLIAFAICFCVCLSRIYLGMHSYLDIIGGCIYSLTISLIFLRFTDFFSYMTKAGLPYGVLLSLAYLFMCFVYPCRTRWSPARADTFLIQGVAIGLTMGMTLKSHLKWDHVGKIRVYNNFDGSNYRSNMPLLFITRSVVGIIFLVLTRILAKNFFYSLIKFVFNLKKASSADIKEFIKKNFYIEIFYYCFCYSNISFSAIFSSYALFEYLRLV